MKRALGFGLAICVFVILFAYQNCGQGGGSQSLEDSSSVPNPTPGQEYTVIPPIGWDKFARALPATVPRPADNWCPTDGILRWCKLEISGVLLKNRTPVPGKQITVCARHPAENGYAEEKDFMTGGCVNMETDSDGNIVKLGTNQPMVLHSCFHASKDIFAVFSGHLAIMSQPAPPATPIPSVPITAKPIFGGSNSYGVLMCPYTSP